MARLRADKGYGDEDYVPELDIPLYHCTKPPGDGTPFSGRRTSPRKTQQKAKLVIRDTEDEEDDSEVENYTPRILKTLTPKKTQRHLKPVNTNSVLLDRVNHPTLGKELSVKLRHKSSERSHKLKGSILFPRRKPGERAKLFSDCCEDETNPTVRKTSTFVFRKKSDSVADSRHDWNDVVESSSMVAPEKMRRLDGSAVALSSALRISSEPTSRPTSSSDNDGAALLSYEPAKHRSPHRIQQAKTSRPRTPSPVPSPAKTKLTSPAKSRAIIIPPTTHRPSIDAFWSQAVVNEWNDQYSPRKVMTSPRKQRWRASPFDAESDDDIPSPTVSPRKSPSKLDRAAKELRKAFDVKKHELAVSFFEELDDKITKGQIAGMTAKTGGVKIIWSKKLNSTAGRANWRREGRSAISAESSCMEKTYLHHASVELAEKVIDDERRLLNTLAHEFCHLANFMVSGVKDRPHGKEFKAWAAKVSRVFRDRDIEVTTKHDYQIEYKYVWECVDCGHEYKRHSKSIDIAKHACGACKGKLLQTKPAPRGNAGKLSGYQSFVKEQFQRVKAENPEFTHAALMEVLGRLYRENKESEETRDEASGHLMRQTSVDTHGDDVEQLADTLKVVVIED